MSRKVVTLSSVSFGMEPAATKPKLPFALNSWSSNLGPLLLRMLWVVVSKC